tara:strand:+ start:5127 stop:5594 length:468 start_codon:yes stop_codon:yes gene_type:complete
MNNIKVAFYKGEGLRRDKFIRWWTNSPYSHVELVMPSGIIAGIRPPDDPVIRRRCFKEMIEEEWELVNIEVNPKQLNLIRDFIDNTSGHGYDWVGMIASHLMPLKVSIPNRWYCSEWVAYALAVSRVIPKKQSLLYKSARISPGKLYRIIKNLRV